MKERKKEGMKEKNVGRKKCETKKGKKSGMKERNNGKKERNVK